jgi:hypothetical protein
MERITTAEEYEAALVTQAANREFETRLRRELESKGLTVEEVYRAMQPIVSFNMGLKEEIGRYVAGMVPPATES